MTGPNPAACDQHAPAVARWRRRAPTPGRACSFGSPGARRSTRSGGRRAPKRRSWGATYAASHATLGRVTRVPSCAPRRARSILVFGFNSSANTVSIFSELDPFPHRLVVLLPPSPREYSTLHNLAPRPYTYKLIGMVGEGPQNGSIAFSIARQPRLRRPVQCVAPALCLGLAAHRRGRPHPRPLTPTSHPSPRSGSSSWPCHSSQRATSPWALQVRHCAVGLARSPPWDTRRQPCSAVDSTLAGPRLRHICPQINPGRLCRIPLGRELKHPEHIPFWRHRHAGKSGSATRA